MTQPQLPPENQATLAAASGGETIPEGQLAEPTTQAWDAKEVGAELARKLSPRARHVCVLLGAGASKAAGVPDLAELKNQVLVRVGNTLSPGAKAIVEALDLEAALTRIRRIAILLSGDESIAELTSETAATADTAVCGAIVAVISECHTDSASHRDLATWVSRCTYSKPIELFTINYDLLVEQALEELGLPYFDGFVGSIEARFRADLVEPAFADERIALPEGFLRLWKLHGSLNWSTRSAFGGKQIVRISGSGQPASIFPSDEKYEDSRRVPFVVLGDRFRRALEEPETVLMVSGYSFGDQHLNEVIFDSLSRHPRLAVEAFFYVRPADFLVDKARLFPGLSCYWPEGGIVGGRDLVWSGDEDIADVFVGGKLLLGDFKHLGSFLARGTSPGHVSQ